MQLIDLIQDIAQKSMKASSPTELAIGAVTCAAPLEILTQTSMQTLKAPVLYLTEAVVEKKLVRQPHTHELPNLGHRHTLPEGSTTGQALQGMLETNIGITDTQCIEHGVALPATQTEVTLNRGLAVGDKVLLLRVMGGQMFVILSRIYEGAN